MKDFLIYCFGLVKYHAYIASADNAQVPPVPIPNTVVKLSRAENTCLETDWEDRKVLALFFYIFSFSSVGRAADC